MKIVGNANVRPYAFERVFSLTADEPLPVVADVEEENSSLIALKREMEMMKEAHAAELARVRTDGFQAGLDQAKSERENALLMAMDALHAGFEANDEEQQRFRDGLIREAAELALSAAETLAGHALESQPGQAIDDAIGRVLQQVSRGEEVHIRVHPDLAEDIEKRIAERQSRDRRKLRLTVSADGSVPCGDATFSWERGGMALDAEARRKAIRAELMNIIPPSDRTF